MVLTIIQTSKEMMMLITDSDRLLKRITQKKLSIDLAIRAKIFVENNFPNDNKFIRRMIRQIDCNNRLIEMEDGRILARYCGQKTCYICNTVRLVKFIKKYLNAVKELKYKYHLVLTARNPDDKNLELMIDKMFRFFRNSGLLKNKSYKSLNKKVKMIRSFESTLNEKSRSFNVHFHSLVAGDDEEEIRRYCELIIEYWLKYFNQDANKGAQYMSPQKKSELENFKYLLKLKNVTESNMYLFYNLIKALEGRRLFMAKNIRSIKKTLDDIKELNKEYDSSKEKIKRFFYYSDKQKNFFDSENKMMLENDELIEKARVEKIERKNLIELKEYLKEKSIETDINKK